jgi:AhpD family alkylhydroperoxidase
MKHTSRVFSINEQFHNILHASSAFIRLRQLKKLHLFTKDFKERIMLAVTEVNGCALCSYVHTKAALSSGMSQEDISQLLSGEHKNVPQEDSIAVLFAQHFASSKEKPNKEAMDRLIETYGTDKAEAVLGFCYMITMTNGMGISLDHFVQRLQFKRNKASTILTEITIPLLTMSLFPITLLYKSICCLFRSNNRLLSQS